jgi:hypothetical protein
MRPRLWMKPGMIPILHCPYEGGQRCSLPEVDLSQSYRSDDTRAVGTDESGLVLGLEDIGDADHVVLGNALSDTDNEANLGLNGLLDTLCSNRGRDEDGRSGSASLLDSVGDSCKDGLAQMCLSGLLGVGTTDDLSAVLNGLLGVEGTLLSSEALEDDLGLVVDAEVGVGGQVGGRGAAVGARGGAQDGAHWLSEALHGREKVVVLRLFGRGTDNNNFLHRSCFSRL